MIQFGWIHHQFPLNQGKIPLVKIFRNHLDATKIDYTKCSIFLNDKVPRMRIRMHLLQVMHLVVVKIPQRLPYLISQRLARVGFHPFFDVLASDPIHGNDSFRAQRIVVFRETNVGNVGAGFGDLA